MERCVLLLPTLRLRLMRRDTTPQGVDGGAEARLQALRKRHPKPSMVKLLKRVRSRMSQCSMWEKADMCKACALPAAVLAACERLLVCLVVIVSYGFVASARN